MGIEIERGDWRTPEGRRDMADKMMGAIPDITKDLSDAMESGDEDALIFVSHTMAEMAAAFAVNAQQVKEMAVLLLVERHRIARNN